MKRKKGKPVNFDVIVKFFMQHYDIPTRTDFNKLIKRLDHLEKLLTRAAATGRGSKAAAGRKGRPRSPSSGGETAADRVLEIIGQFNRGATVEDIRSGTGFDAKKIRNILYRLHKGGRIIRKGRGVYSLS